MPGASSRRNAPPGFTTILYLASWPSAAGLSPCHQAQPSVGRSATISASCPPLATQPDLCNQLQFWSAVSSCHPRLALYSLTQSARTPFHAEPVQCIDRSTCEKGTAFVPTIAKTEAGYWMAIEPVDVGRGRKPRGAAIDAACSDQARESRRRHANQRVSLALSWSATVA